MIYKKMYYSLVGNTTIKLKEEAMNDQNKIYSKQDITALKKKLSYKATEIGTALLGRPNDSLSNNYCLHWGRR